jgi:hypothetical protein
LWCSEERFEAGGVAGGDLKVGAGAVRPLLRHTRRGLRQMRDGEPGAQHGAVGPVEVQQRCRGIFVEPALDPHLEVAPGPRRADPLTLQVQIGDLIEGVDRTQARIELQAVDDADRVIEPDVLGPHKRGAARLLTRPDFVGSADTPSDVTDVDGRMHAGRLPVAQRARRLDGPRSTFYRRALLHVFRHGLRCPWQCNAIFTIIGTPLAQG